MKRKLFLTSLIATGLIRPATAETFPADGYMQENKTYEEAATYANTGVYDGSVTATAEYTDNVYNIVAGTYLPAGAETATTCQAGKFCPGKTNATYDESGDQGLSTCPTDFPNSDAGASAQTQCYTACTLANANIAHATAVSGNDYFGDGADTCAATECDPGYHVNSEVKMVDKTPLIPVDYTLGGDGSAWINASGVAGNNDLADAGLTEKNTWAAHFEYGTVYGRASCQPNPPAGLNYVMETNPEEVGFDAYISGLAEIVGTTKAAYVANLIRDSADAEAAGDMEAMEALEGLMFEMLFSGVLDSDPNANYSTDSIGFTCYCQMTGYTPTGGSFESITAASWVFHTELDSTDTCASECAEMCGGGLVLDVLTATAFRTTMFGARAFETGGTCAANDIKIQWSDAEEIGDAGMCKYGGDITTPVKAVTKKGKTFKGWRFEKAN